MSALDHLRLAWEAHRDGRSARRDALLTLALAASHPGRHPWITPIRAALAASRPDHLFAGFATIDQALADPRVASRLGRLRASFPPARVRHLIGRSNVARGPFSGRSPDPAAMIEELTATSPARLGSASPAPEPSEAQAPRFSREGLGFPPDADPVLAFYLSTLLATATLFALVLRERGRDQRAA